MQDVSPNVTEELEDTHIETILEVDDQPSVKMYCYDNLIWNFMRKTY